MAQYKDDRLHGLTIYWYADGDIAVYLDKNGKELGEIRWNTNTWTEVRSKNKSVFDGVLSIDDFRPDAEKKE